jgi:hypothetical protein
VCTSDQPRLAAANSTKAHPQLRSPLETVFKANLPCPSLLSGASPALGEIFPHPAKGNSTRVGRSGQFDAHPAGRCVEETPPPRGQLEFNPLIPFTFHTFFNKSLQSHKMGLCRFLSG